MGDDDIVISLQINLGSNQGLRSSEALGLSDIYSKFEAGYRSTNGEYICCECCYFKPEGYCEIVIGQISEDCTCNFWEENDTRITDKEEFFKDVAE